MIIDVQNFISWLIWELIRGTWLQKHMKVNCKHKKKTYINLISNQLIYVLSLISRRRFKYLWPILHVHKPYAWKTFPDHKLLLLIWFTSALARSRLEQQNFVSKYLLISFGQNNKYMSHFIDSLTSFTDLAHISFGQKWTRPAKFCDQIFVNQLWPEWQISVTLK
jgi:glutathionylspermidine synthase